ncbi:MAG: PH domain-containing protein [Mycobacteriales bacterium]
MTVGAGSAVVVATEGWRRLDRRMLAMHPVQEVIRFAPALIGLLIGGSGSGDGPLWSLIGVAVVVGLGLLRYATTTFRITPDQVQVRKGLLRRRVLAVPMDRIRTVDVTANPLHRALGLARVEVGTGRTDRKKQHALLLDSLSAPTAESLRDELLHRRGRAARPAVDDVAGSATEIVRLDARWVRYGPFTLSGIVTIGVVVALLSNAANEAKVSLSRLGGLHSARTQLAGIPAWAAALEILAMAAVLTAVASTIAYLLAFWNFQLIRRSEGTLHISRGLLTTRSTTIEERRLHGVELSEPLLLRAVGGARCIAITTGLRVGRGAERGGSILLPPAPRRDAVAVGARVLGDEHALTAAVVHHGPRATRRRYTRALGVTGVAVIIVVILVAAGVLPLWSVIAAAVTVPLAGALAADRAHSLGHAVVDRCLVARRGSLVRRRSMIRANGVIGWNLHRSFFQRRAGLLTLTATTAAGRQAYAVQDTCEDVALRIADDLTPLLITPFLAIGS